MVIPTPHTVHVRRYSTAGEDSYGNAVVVYGDPEPWKVHGIAPGASTHPLQAQRDLSEIIWTVYGPKNDDAPGDRDLVVVDGREYAVNRFPGDWTHGPWDHPDAGLAVELRRAEG